MKNLKKKIEEIIDKIKNDKEFAKKFKKDPVKALEDISGIDIPEDKIEEVITTVQAKVKIDKVDLLINIVMLIPIGLTVVYFNNKSIVSKFVVLVIVGVVMGVSLETIQFILPVVRSVQLSDALLNTFSVVLGGIIGLLYNFVTCRIKRKK